jgi:Outer membrane lipoprotein-sorting protein
MKILSAVAAIIFLVACCAPAETTEIQGRNLAKQLADTNPTENFTNTGILEIRHRDGPTDKLSFRFQTVLTATNWQVIYETTSESYRVKFVVVHDGDKIGLFQIREDKRIPIEFSFPFAGSDFWLGDLGLEFFHWPEQKILKKEFARGRGCEVLESTNPDPMNGYSRVLTWIDEETGGIVQAKAYDARGKLLKEFYPKDFKKVNGQWELQEMEIDNVQTGSRTRLEFTGFGTANSQK